jgi:hypothetical protein
MVGPSRLEAVREILNGLAALPVPNHEACHRSTDRTRHPEECLHLFVLSLSRSFDVARR